MQLQELHLNPSSFLWVHRLPHSSQSLFSLSRTFLQHCVSICSLYVAFKAIMCYLFISSPRPSVSQASVRSNPSYSVYQVWNNAWRGGGHRFHNVRVPGSFEICRIPKHGRCLSTLRNMHKTGKFRQKHDMSNFKSPLIHFIPLSGPPTGRYHISGRSIPLYFGKYVKLRKCTKTLVKSRIPDLKYC